MKLGRTMPKEPIDGPEPTFSEDDIQREQLRPRGAPGGGRPRKDDATAAKEDA